MEKQKVCFYEVIVGNVGTVYRGDSASDAETAFADYVNLSKTIRSGRASGESVTLMCNGDIAREHGGM